MLRSALFPEPFAGNPQLLVDEARRLVKQRLARPRQVEALRREIRSATGASISAKVLAGFVGQRDGQRPRNPDDRRTLLAWANWAVDRPRCQRCAAVQHLCPCSRRRYRQGRSRMVSLVRCCRARRAGLAKPGPVYMGPYQHNATQNTS